MGFARFMSGTAGRLARIIAGIVLIVIGLAAVGGTAGWIIAIIGIAPIAAGVFNFCLIAPFIGAPFRGDDAQTG